MIVLSVSVVSLSDGLKHGITEHVSKKDWEKMGCDGQEAMKHELRMQLARVAFKPEVEVIDMDEEITE